MLSIQLAALISCVQYIYFICWFYKCPLGDNNYRNFMNIYKYIDNCFYAALKPHKSIFFRTKEFQLIFQILIKVNFFMFLITNKMSIQSPLLSISKTNKSTQTISTMLYRKCRRPAIIMSLFIKIIMETQTIQGPLDLILSNFRVIQCDCRIKIRTKSFCSISKHDIQFWITMSITALNLTVITATNDEELTYAAVYDSELGT